MNTFSPPFLVAVLLLCAYPASAQTNSPPNSNGAIVEEAHYSYPMYDHLPDALKRAYTKEVYETLKNRSDFECLRIKYITDGLKVVGFVYKPKLLNLVPLARSLGYVDMNNLFMWGFSRGGMMTFLAVKNGVPINAAATVGATLDFTSPGPLPPQAVQRLRNLWPDYENRAEEHQTNRSAMKWAERINVPTLILHGGADRNVPASQVLAFAQRLQELGKVYELMIYAGDDHGLSLNRADGEGRIVRWFKKYIK